MGRDIILMGQKVECFYKAAGEYGSAYVKFVGDNSRGAAKFGFVGMNSDGKITKIHVQSGKDIWKTLSGSATDKVVMEVLE